MIRIKNTVILLFQAFVPAYVIGFGIKKPKVYEQLTLSRKKEIIDVSLLFLFLEIES